MGKADHGKPRWELLPFSALSLVARAFTEGAKKHGPWDWAEVPAEEYIGAANRHAAAIASGERLDPETGLPHAAHWAASVLIYLTLSEGLPLPPWAKRPAPQAEDETAPTATPAELGNWGIPV